MTVQGVHDGMTLDPAPLLSGLEGRRLAGYEVSTATQVAALDCLVAGFHLGLRRKVAFFNSNFVVSRSDAGLPPEELRDFLILNDGVAASLVSQLVIGRGFEHNLNGTDLVPALLRRLPAETRVFLYGGRDGVAGRAGERMVEAMGVTLCGYAHGYGVDRARVARAAREAGAEVVLVALGNPLQERWIAQHADDTGARLVIGVGALLDFMSGTATRAPTWVRRMRGEWLYRMLREPRRLARRYSVDVARFLAIALQDAHRGGGHRGFDEP